MLAQTQPCNGHRSYLDRAFDQFHFRGVKDVGIAMRRTPTDHKQSVDSVEATTRKFLLANKRFEESTLM